MGKSRHTSSHHKNIMATYEYCGLRVEGRASDRSRSQRRTSTRREDLGRRGGPPAAHSTLTTMDPDPSTNS